MINESNTSIMFGGKSVILHNGEITDFKRHNDAGGYYVRGLWIAPSKYNGAAHSYPWELNVPNGAFKDKNDGWRFWGLCSRWIK